MTQNVAQGPRSFGVVSLLRPRDLWAKLPKAVLLVLLVMTGAFVQAEVRYVWNLTSYNIRASLDYGFLCPGDTDILIKPGARYDANSGPCGLTGIVIWMDDAGGAPSPKHQKQVVYRWHPGSNRSHGVWKVRLNEENVMEVKAMLFDGSGGEAKKQEFWNYVYSGSF